MNNNDLQQEIQKLEGQLTELKKKVDAMGNSQSGPPFWQPRSGDTYYAIASCGAFLKRTNHNEPWDKNRIARGNCFQTQELAEKESKVVGAFMKLRAIAKHFNGDWELDPNSAVDEEISYITKDINRIYVTSQYNYHPIETGAVYFKNESDAKKALEIMGSDIDYLFFGK